MGHIINDIVDDIDIKPNKRKFVLKLVISVAVTLIGLAFVFGQLKSNFVFKMDKFETTINKNAVVIKQLEKSTKKEIEMVNVRIDKVYDDGQKILNGFQIYYNKQLELIIEYGDSNKDLLKRMMEINSLEKNVNVETEFEKAKTETIK